MCIRDSQFTVGPPYWLPNIQTHKERSVWRPCTDEAWSWLLYMTSTGVSQGSALLIESWRCVYRSQGHCYMTSGSWLPGRQMISPVGHHRHRHEDWVAHPWWNSVLEPSSFAGLLLDQVVWLPHEISLEQEHGAPVAQQGGYIICKVQISEWTLSKADIIHSLPTDLSRSQSMLVAKESGAITQPGYTPKANRKA